jgi:hypothetical protein
MKSARTKKWILSILSLLVLLTLVSAGVVGNRLKSWRVPPDGKLVYQNKEVKIYRVASESQEAHRKIKQWAGVWGARIPGRTYGGYGGELAIIAIVEPGTDLRFETGEVLHVNKGELMVMVRDLPLTPSGLWLRLKSLL